MLWSTGDESSLPSCQILTHSPQEIHKKITSIGFDDCKVFIHSVDAQSSANGGIIIQVIGEMSNHGEQWRKFVQTFFLAEQPNGYFVLNDIFRFLKEETIEGDDTSEPLEPVEAEPAALTGSASAAIPTEPAVTVSAPDPIYEQPREATPAPPAPVAEPVQPVPPAEEQPKLVEPVLELTQTPVPEFQPTVTLVSGAQPNGHATEEEEAAVIEPSAAFEPPKLTPGPPAPVPAPAQPQQSPAPAPHQPVPPPQPRSWASLAATNQKKWGPVAQHEKGMSETVISSSASGSGTQTPATPQTPTPAGGHHHGRQGQQRHELLHAAQSITTAHCFVKVRKHCSVLVFSEANIYLLHKGVTENISQVQLSQTLTSRFGPIKELELVRSRACAFLEFTSLDFARRAIIASLSQNQGGEGGIFIDVGGEQARIFVETKKEKGDRPPGRPHRGGATGQQVNGGERGGAPQGGGAFRGRSGGRGGRGGSQK